VNGEKISGFINDHQLIIMSLIAIGLVIYYVINNWEDYVAFIENLNDRWG